MIDRSRPVASGPRPRRTRAFAGASALAAVLAVTLGACSASGAASPTTSGAATSSTSDTSTEASGTTSATASSSAASSGSGSATATAAAGCADTTMAEPSGATTREVPDVDGDGRPDTGWIAAGGDQVVFGVSTAAGGSFGTTFALAGGAEGREVLITPVDSTTVVALATDGRTVLLFRVLDCQVRPVLNAQGSQYEFSLGFTGYGTGVGCSTDGSTPTGLLGLLATTSGNTTTVASTRILIDGLTATNGATTTTTYPKDDPMAQAAYGVTCGARTLQDDGLLLEPAG
ncbi:hypothetical protein OEB99_04440 [Actinotalea sp. M2MS4P-6]|uniref:hypothetical protein n=1 Tax=Actinotalea sp. M2MS4P-6 TaxID=2983762 RepID=UPI0021E4031A|nr:hypothetical protein [Actinotalea sp. M2MS4P-6]MCV2393548.1 hypothetical protein [Actinotalea sp. M2MS4P-6]